MARKRTVIRDAVTGKFTSSKACSKSSLVQEVEVSTHSLDVGRSDRTGRFVKKTTAKRHPSKAHIENIKH